MTPLVLVVVLAQPWNYNPYRPAIMSRQDGAALSGRPQYAIDCDSASMSCAVDGGVLLLASLGGGGGADGGAPANATYITQTASSGLTNEQALSSLTTGVVKVTNGTGVLSTAAAGTDYAAPTSGTSVLLGNGTGGFSSYAGTSCTNQFPRSLSAAGAATCASVALGSDVSGTLSQARGGTGAGALTCSAGDFLTSNGTVYSCATPSSGASTGLMFVTSKDEPTLSSDQSIGLLTTGLLLNTVAAAQGTLSAYGGSSCTNQFPRSVNASGAWTCASVALNADVTSKLGVTNGGTGLNAVATNEVLVGTAADTFTAKTLPSCSNGTTSKLLYDNATQTWSCGTDQGGSGMAYADAVAASLGGF